MATYLITYDLQDPSKEKALLDYLVNGTLATKSSYLLTTSSETPQQLVDAIRAIANDKIHVYVFTIAKPYYGFGPNAANDWLTKHLP
jgi:hypothetical protein